MATTNVPSENIGMSDLAEACGVEIRTNLSLNGLRAGNGGDLSTTDTDSGETTTEFLDNSETGVDVSDGSVFTDEYIRIDSEYMKIQYVTSNTLTCISVSFLLLSFFLFLFLPLVVKILVIVSQISVVHYLSFSIIH